MTHIVDGEFQSDKYPTCPPGKVPLSTKDKAAQDLLWQYAQRRRAVDEEFADDLEQALRDKGYDPERLPDADSQIRALKKKLRAAEALVISLQLEPASLAAEVLTMHGLVELAEQREMEARRTAEEWRQESNDNLSALDRVRGEKNRFLRNRNEFATALAEEKKRSKALEVELEWRRLAARLRPAVLWFASLMESALRRNDHKGCWQDSDTAYLFRRLTEEKRELQRAIGGTADADKVQREAADVANFAMMIADQCTPVTRPDDWYGRVTAPERCPHGRVSIDCDDNAMSCGCCGARPHGDEAWHGRCPGCPMGALGLTAEDEGRLRALLHAARQEVGPQAFDVADALAAVQTFFQERG